jgi:hypothetical protein
MREKEWGQRGRERESSRSATRRPRRARRTTPTRVRQRLRLATRVHPRARSFSAMWRSTSFRRGVASRRLASFSLCAPPPTLSTHLRSVASYWFADSARARNALLYAGSGPRESARREENARGLCCSQHGAERRGADTPRDNSSTAV